MNETPTLLRLPLDHPLPSRRVAVSGTSRRPFPLPGAATLLSNASLSKASVAGTVLRREAGFWLVTAVALFVALAS